MRALLIAVATLALAATAKAQNIAVALTQEVVEVDAGFAGARLNLFGAVSGIDNPATDYDIIAVIRGPTTDFVLRRLERRNLIWMPGEAYPINDAPGVYLTAATRPVSDIAPLPDQAANALRADLILHNAGDPRAQGIRPLYSEMIAEALIEKLNEKGLYQENIDGVSFKKGPLFAIEAELPGVTPVGEYEIKVFLYRQGVLLGADSAKLVVNKVGLERRIYDLAHENPLSYGVLCVALSLIGGWIAGFAFRKS